MLTQVDYPWYVICYCGRNFVWNSFYWGHSQEFTQHKIWVIRGIICWQKRPVNSALYRLLRYNDRLKKLFKMVLNSNHYTICTGNWCYNRPYRHSQMGDNRYLGYHYRDSPGITCRWICQTTRLRYRAKKTYLEKAASSVSTFLHDLLPNPITL